MDSERSSKAPITTHPTVLASLEKFYGLNEDLFAVQATTRRVFFEFLHTKPTLTTEELDTLWSVADLLAGICAAKEEQNANQ